MKKRKVPEAFKAFMKKKGENHLTPSKAENQKKEKREFGRDTSAREKYQMEVAERILKGKVS